MQYLAMVMDVSILQPTSSPILSYLMHGMNDSGTMPEWRLSSEKTWAAIWSSYNVITQAACIGLLSNHTLVDRLKIQPHLQAFTWSILQLSAMNIAPATLTDLHASTADIGPALRSHRYWQPCIGIWSRSDASTESHSLHSPASA